MKWRLRHNRTRNAGDWYMDMTKATSDSAAAQVRVHGTKEWAKSTVNIQCGCENGCRYCYAKAMAIRYKRATSDGWQTPAPNLKAMEKGFRKRGGRIMFPSSHDITPVNIDACVTTLKRMLDAGNDVVVVTKPRGDCVRRLCLELEPFKARVLFRFTMGSADDAVLGYWEPGAPAFAERLEALSHAHASGYATSVSMEPMLDGDPGAVIEAVRPCVTDKVWLGKANRLLRNVRMNCPGDAEAMVRAKALAETQKDGAIRRLYKRYRSDPLITWKDSIKKVVGIENPQA